MARRVSAMVVGLILACGCAQRLAPPTTRTVDASLSADRALEMLKAGNERYASGRPLHPDQSPERRAELVSGQRPYAVILSCSDSRVPPELVFDAGLGEIFVIRVAGNIADDVAIASIDFSGAPDAFLSNIFGVSGR